MICCMRPDCQDTHCPGRQLVMHMHQNDGGVSFHRGIVFPIEQDRTETMPAHFRLKRAPDAFAVAMVGVLRWAPVVFFVIAVGTFWFLEIMKGKP